MTTQKQSFFKVILHRIIKYMTEERKQRNTLKNTANMEKYIKDFYVKFS